MRSRDKFESNLRIEQYLYVGTVIIILAWLVTLPVNAQVERPGQSFVPRACIYFHSSVSDVLAIPEALKFVKIVSFDDLCGGDPRGRLKANLVNSTLDVKDDSSGGSYIGIWSATISSVAGGQDDRIITVGIELKTPLIITGATNTIPIVITSMGHDLFDGDMVEVEGVIGNTSANGLGEIFDILPNSFSLRAIDGVSLAGSGNYVSGGTISTIYLGVAAQTAKIANSPTSMGGNDPGRVTLLGEDQVGLYIANLQGTKSVEFGSVLLAAVRLIGSE